MKDIVLSGICSEIENVNTQFVVGKFCNENPVVQSVTSRKKL